nr:cytochrome c [Meinhardsimonia xiamenensis]
MLTLLMLTGATAQAEEARDVERLVRQDCGSCHGLTLKGGLGPAITPEAVAKYDDETLAEIILDGVPDTPMPPWRALLGPGELEAIIAYLRKGESQ